MPPVRNLTNIGGIPIHHYIPPAFNPIYKIEVFNGTTSLDVTDYVIEGEYTDGITNTIGNFTFKIDNSSQQYTDIINLYDRVRVYLDYGSEATTLKFLGYIERASKTDSTMVLTGRSGAVRTIGKNITYTATDTPRSSIISEIISNNFSGIITTNNLTSDAETMSVNFVDKPFLECMTEICYDGNYDWYIDVNLDLHYFPSESILNETEVVVHDGNLISVGDFSPDLQPVINKVRVYGNKTGTCPIIYTAKDSSSIDNYDAREVKITDNSIITAEQAQQRAEAELDSNPPTVGEVTSLILPTLSPGEKLRISDPLNGLVPDNPYLVYKFTHKFSNDDPPQTVVTMKQDRVSLSGIVKSRVKFETGIGESDNPNDFDYSYVWTFDSDTGTHSNTEIVRVGENNDGVLKVIDGQTSGTWLSEIINTPRYVSGIEVRMNGTSMDGSQIRITATGSAPYVLVTSAGTPLTTGTDIQVQLDLLENAQITSLAVLYNMFD